MEELIPTGWQIVSIGEVTLPIEKTDPSRNPNQGIDYLDISGIDNKSNRILEAKHYLGKDAPSRARQLIKREDILFSTVRTYLKNIAMVPGEYDGQVASTGFSILRAAEGINSKFLFYYTLTQGFLNPLTELQRGSSYPAVRDDDVRIQKIPIAPHNEQKRIVAKIEELFSELDNATRCLLVAKAQQKIFYQSVLDNAFSNCKEHKKLEDLLSQKLSNGYSGKPVRYETNYRVLSLSSTTSGVFLDYHFKFLDEPALEDRDIWCEPHDILIQRGNTIEYVGVPAIFTGMPRRFIFPDLMIRVKANENLISPKFLYYALSSPKIRNYLRQKAKGSAGTMPKINQSILASLPIPFCSKEIQKKIVEDIEEKLSNGLAIERTIEESLSKSEILRQSILKKAFSGRLVAQDPNDDPASVLLEHIRVEKDAQKTESRKPKAKRNAA